ncbi:MAG: GNAT family N-acetyltransferase [Aureliella sp.]
MLVFEILSSSHLRQLYAFESRNREWFESLIAPREASFYSERGVRQHIQSQIEAMDIGETMSWLALNGDEIVARANLKNICTRTRTAEVGYRVGKSSTAQGFGSACLAHLIQFASTNLSLNKLFGYVLDNNPASKRILEKHGFYEILCDEQSYTIQGVSYGRVQLGRDL